MKFTTTNVNTTYSFYPNVPINVYQLFVVGGGAPGGDSRQRYNTGGFGGQITGYNYSITSITDYIRVPSGNQNIFNFIVGAGNNDSTTTFTNALIQNYTAKSGGNDYTNYYNKQNLFTNLIYGGMGGAYNHLDGYPGGGGGCGGGSSGRQTVYGGIGANGGGKGGRPTYLDSNTGRYTAPESGVTGSGLGGGAGGLPSSVSGGGGGGAGELGGGGGAIFDGNESSPAKAGSGGSGVILLIFTT